MGGDASSPPSPILHYLLACCAATISETVTYPLDLVKVLLQLQNERGQSLLQGAAAAAAPPAAAGTGTGAAPRPPPPLQSMTALLRGMARNGALFSGLSISILRQCLNAGVSVGLYPTLRAALLAPGEDKERMPLYKRALAGAATGCIGQALAQPTDVVKVRVQADTRLRAAGLAPRYAGVGDAFARIVAQEGVRGLYTALGSSVWRAGIINSAGIASYDGTKQVVVGWLREGGSAALQQRLPRQRAAAAQEHLPSLCAAAVCGVVSTVVSCPLDVVKTRIMNSRPGTYTGPNDCLVQLIRAEGLASMWKGVLPTYYVRCLSFFFLRSAPRAARHWGVHTRHTAHTRTHTHGTRTHTCHAPHALPTGKHSGRRCGMACFGCRWRMCRGRWGTRPFERGACY
jgi:solute carrier family 25 uncoupling protein 27